MPMKADLVIELLNAWIKGKTRVTLITHVSETTLFAIKYKKGEPFSELTRLY